ncbi:hypothetical protein E2C01_007299 [Portunus trituberculatus]|uniref:Uncharacterized protein n=1 Tax=Portunus trituberculatus TaxID=210409 RepID=A0A5B7D052_PORTR|nr:hypothetical protein [Portunus trituberculatus]
MTRQGWRVLVNTSHLRLHITPRHSALVLTDRNTTPVLANNNSDRHTYTETEKVKRIERETVESFLSNSCPASLHRMGKIKTETTVRTYTKDGKVFAIAMVRQGQWATRYCPLINSNNNDIRHELDMPLRHPRPATG